MKYMLTSCFLIFLYGCNAGEDQLSSGFISDARNTLAARPICSDNAAEYDEIWGFENNSSCRWPLVSAESFSSRFPECTTDAANHGDGWGFENDQSCRWGNSTLPGAQSDLACSDSAVDHGDGWGWEKRPVLQMGRRDTFGSYFFQRFVQCVH